MKTTISLLILTALTASLAIGQQPSPQPTQARPCVTTTTPDTSGNNTTIKLPSKWRQAINKQLQAVQSKIPVPLPDPSTTIEQAANAKPAPCLLQAATAKSTQLAQAPSPKLPADATVQLHCTPVSPKDANGHSTLILPNPNDFSTPKPGDYLVDSVIPDLSAKTGCWQVKVDPVTKKSFIAQ